MNGSDLLELLDHAQRELGCKEVALRCDHENLETVYAMRRGAQLVVSDRGDTFQFLDQDDSGLYDRISAERAKAICRRHGAELDVSDPELYPIVLRVVAEGPVQDAVNAVAAAVDALFNEAQRRLRNRLKGRHDASVRDQQG